MNLGIRFLKAIRRHPAQFLRLPVYASQFMISHLEVRCSPRIHRARPVHGSPEEIIKALTLIEYRPKRWALDVEDYRRYCQAADYKKRNYYASDTIFFWEKSLEHYLSLKFLELQPEDILIDVASDQSAFPGIVKDLHHCQSVYCQDLIYAPGIHGDQIGGNAANMPVPDNFATKLVLHNSFEHFEGNSDSGFIREAARILKPGGRFVIIPLFVGLSYYYVSSYFRSRRGVFIEQDAKWYLLKGFLQRHARFYDVNHLKSRVLEHGSRFDFEIFYTPNVREVHPMCDCDFALLGTKRE